MNFTTKTTRARRLFLPLIAAFSIAITGNSWAQSGTNWFGDTADGQWLAGIKLGRVSHDSSRLDEVTNATLVLGYQFSRSIGDRGTASVELELGDTLDEGSIGGTSGEWDLGTVGVYMTYRSPGTVYWKGTIGIQRTDVGTGNFGSPAFDETDTNLAYGAGLGILLGPEQNVNLEVEWVHMSGDNDLNAINIGGHVRF